MKTWITIVMTTLIFSIFLTILRFAYRYFFSSKKTNKSNTLLQGIGNSLMYTISIQLQQGNNYFLKSTINFNSIFFCFLGGSLSSNQTARTSFRLVVGLWLLMTVILANLYTSTITSYLTATKLEPIASTLEELVTLFEQRHGNCLITMQKTHPLLHNFKVNSRLIDLRNLLCENYCYSLYRYQTMELTKR